MNFKAACIFSNSITLLNMNSTQATQVNVKEEFLQKFIADDNFCTISVFSRTKLSHLLQHAKRSRLAIFATALASFSFVALWYSTSCTH